MGEAFPKWVAEPRADVPRVTARTAFAMLSSWGGPVTMGPASLSVTLLEHESSGAFLVGSSEIQQADTSMRAGAPRGLRDPPWVRDQPQLTLFPDGAQGQLPVPRCAWLGEQRAKSLLLRGVCQCQRPDAPSQTFHQQWHLLFSRLVQLRRRQGAHFQLRAFFLLSPPPQVFPWGHRLLCILWSAWRLAAVSTFWLPMVLSMISLGA